MKTLQNLLLAALIGSAALAHAQSSNTVLRMAPHSNLTILDPIWTTAYISRNHGYMIYDTLFGMDEKGKIQPQMVDKWEVSKDQKTWTFALRDGLEFHDGKAVTSDDVIASLTRWAKRDAMGEKLFSYIETIEAVDAKTFRFKLKEPYGLVLDSLGKPGSNTPFIMPKRVAQTPADKQIDEYTGSGPFIFRKDDWKPGEKVVYLKNPKYKPRPEPASGTAGGKVVKFDRVEWIIIKDPQTQVNALTAGEIDVIELPAHESYQPMRANKDIQFVDTNALGYQAMLRFNHTQPPFDNVKVREAAMAALNQLAFLRAQVGVPDMFRTCFSIYPCQSALFTNVGMDLIAKPDFKRAQEMLKASGYDGTPIVIMHPTDLHAIAKLPVVGAQLLRQAGFKVDLQSMDWQTLVARRAKKDPPKQGGWNIFMTIWTAVDVSNPVIMQPINGACEKAWFGWPCDEQLEKLRDAYARATEDSQRKSIAEEVQKRAMTVVTHVPLGEYTVPVAARKNLSGFVKGFIQVIPWNLSKQ